VSLGGDHSDAVNGGRNRQAVFAEHLQMEGQGFLKRASKLVVGYRGLSITVTAMSGE